MPAAGSFPAPIAAGNPSSSSSSSSGLMSPSRRLGVEIPEGDFFIEGLAVDEGGKEEREGKVVGVPSQRLQRAQRGIWRPQRRQTVPEFAARAPWIFVGECPVVVGIGVVPDVRGFSVDGVAG